MMSHVHRVIHHTERDQNHLKFAFMKRALHQKPLLALTASRLPQLSIVWMEEADFCRNVPADH